MSSPAVSHPSNPFLDELRARLGSERCPCGNVHRLPPVELILGEGALESSARTLLRSYGAGKSVWALSDERTEAAAGEGWKRATRTARISSRILPGDPPPVPTIELAGALAAEVRALAPDLLVGVGSGVVSDLVKKVSLDAGLPNWCIATAASVDAYGSARSAIRVAGYHRAVPARPSEVIVCDLEVLVRAPRRLFLAGLGDLLAKYLASLDWRLAARVTGETYCDVVGGFALGSARRAPRSTISTAFSSAPPRSCFFPATRRGSERPVGWPGSRSSTSTRGSSLSSGNLPGKRRSSRRWGPGVTAA